MKPGEYDYFIFDLDGTLFNIPVDWVAVRNGLAKLFGEAVEGTPLFLKIQQVVAARPALRSGAFNLIESQELRAVESAKPLDGAVELVYSLFEISKLGLVTLQGRRACEEILRKHKLFDLFEVVVTREDSLDRAVQLEAALNGLGARPKATLFVGDRLNDVVCAKKVGVPVALVGGRELAEPRPDLGFKSLAELGASFS